MSIALDDLFNDVRLARLFAESDSSCALQLWVLQIKSEQSIENRIVYGRLLPYSFSADEWFASDDDNFDPFGSIQGQVILLNLYVKSTHCMNILRQLSVGRSILEISEQLNLDLSSKQKTRFGAVALASDNLVYRPVAYLLNRDAHDRHSPSSPHHGAGAFSASITQTDKGSLFRVGQGYNVKLTDMVVRRLNEDTGLDFGGTDAVRFGDIELLIFPTLDDQEQSLLSVRRIKIPCAFVIQFNPKQVSYFSGFQFYLSIINDEQIVYSSIATAERTEKGIFEYEFRINDQLSAMVDSTKLEIFGFHGDHLRESTLCCRWQTGYIREINVQGHMCGNKASLIKFDWLEKATRRSSSRRVHAALEMNRNNADWNSHVGGRNGDPWVFANREFVSLFARLHPPKSAAKFFLRWGPGDGEGRLEFAGWFKVLLAKYQKHQIVIFDPYFEDAGLGLLLLYASPGANYIVFTSLPKPAPKGKAAQDGTEKRRIDNLIQNCKHNHYLLKHIKLHIYALKNGRLHDRYILIMGLDGLPVVGFNLSNSLQTVAQNFPLLVTPIPSDTLLEVEKYESELVREAQETAQIEGKKEDSAIVLLFNSTSSPIGPQGYEPLLFLEKAQAGNVLSAWTGKQSLQNLNGDALKEQMATLSLLKNNSLALPDAAAGLHNCLNQAGDFTDFSENWDVLGEILAHSDIDAYRNLDIESEQAFIKFLEQFLETSFNRVHHNEGDKELSVLPARFLRESADNLLHNSYYLEHLSHLTKYTILTWAEYYTIRFLWRYAPSVLLTIAEAKITNLPADTQSQDMVKLSLLSQIVSEISLTIQFEINEEQRGLLVCSRNGLFQWIGLSAIEMELEKVNGLATVRQLLATRTRSERIRALGWMIRHVAEDSKKIGIYKSLIAILYEELPETLSANDLKQLIDSMRGHMRQLAWAEPWLFQDVIFPLLQNESSRANTDDACSIWIQELANMLESKQKGTPLLFNRAREGQTTNIASFLFAYSSSEMRQSSLKSLQKILRQQQRIVRKPLASTANWALWDVAVVTSMWILTFTKWGQYYLRERGISDAELDKLLQDASDLAMVRPMSEWESKGVGTSGGELAAFLSQVEKLLASDQKP
jgi:hypothetical protein